MATPMKSGLESSNDDSDDSLNVSSPKFDPYRALYAKSIELPAKDAKQFNNLAEFENFLKGKDARTQKKSKPPKEKLPEIIAVRAAAQAKEAVRKAAILQRNKGPAERSETQQRKMRLTNVLTKMQKYEIGPLSLLRRSVNEKLKIVVMVRAAVAIRSQCKGYVVAFDKHMNMALMDVDETFLRPLLQKDVPKKTKEKMDDKTARRKNPKPDICVTSLSTVSSVNPENSVDAKDGIVKVEPSPSTSAGSKSAPAPSASSGNSSSPQPSTSGAGRPGLMSYRIPKKSNKQSITENKKSLDSVREASLASRQVVKKEPWRSSPSEREKQYSSDSEVIRKRTDKENRDIIKKNVKSEVNNCALFWPTYKEWAEARCYCKYELVERHVNQLFIRGENVVSVSILS